MPNIKEYIFEYFEQIVVLFILAAVFVLNYFIAEKARSSESVLSSRDCSRICTGKKKSPAYQYF